jgi:hypothetical protein
MARLEEEGEPEALARRAELEKLRAGLPGMPGWFLTDENGPVWFRGLATWDETEMESALVGVLDAFSAQRVVVGHTPQLGKILPRFGGRVYLIDTAMAYGDKGGRAAALEIDGDRVTAVYTDERVPLTEEPSPAAVSPEEPAPVEGTNGQTADAVEGTNGDSQETLTAPEERESAADGESTSPGSPTPIWLGPDGRPLPFADDQEVLEFLAKAKIVGDAKIDVGITKPRRLELERDGIRARAIFHDVEIEKQRIKLHGGELVNFFRDHYANNVAAYELSRLLGMTNVPPAVVRRLGGQPGSVQLWIENAKTDADRRQMEIEPPAASRLTRLDMWVFDNLINNIDRNQTNILYDANWNLWFIDHTRTFGRGKELPSPERVSRCSRRLWRALLELDEEETRKRLKPFLGIYEIRGMLARRKLLIALLEERIARLGEKAVLFSYSDSSVTAGEEEIEIPEAPAPPRD